MLPLLLGLGGSALGAAGMLGGMGALAGGALGSGLGSLAQGDDLGTAVGTGLLSYFGGKAMQGMLGSGAASGANEAAKMGATNLFPGQPLPGGLQDSVTSGF